jgi:hypothetical protein
MPLPMRCNELGHCPLVASVASSGRVADLGNSPRRLSWPFSDSSRLSLRSCQIQTLRAEPDSASEVPDPCLH